MCSTHNNAYYEGNSNNCQIAFIVIIVAFIVKIVVFIVGIVAIIECIVENILF